MTDRNLPPGPPPPESRPAVPASPSASTTLSGERVAELVQAMRQQIGNAVVGQQKVIDQLLTAFLAAGHVLLEGVPGLGKTLSVLALARTFNGTFSRIQFTPDLMPADVTGHSMLDPKTGQFVLRRGPAFTHLLLADEINRAPAKTQAALLEVMQEQQISIEGHTLELPPPFMTVATQNPIEHDGTYPLPEAQLDRFLLKLEVDYPEEAHEVALVEKVTDARKGEKLDVSRVRPVLDPSLAVAIQDHTARVLLDRRVTEYAVRIVRTCRELPGVRVGPGPRGAIALVRAARAWAVLCGRDYVMPEDVKSVALPCLTHRILPTPDLEIEGQAVDLLIAELLDTVPAPRD